MLKKILLVGLIWMVVFHGFAQQGKVAPQGFDQKKELKSYGKIDTITYSSKTVGINRRALVYTPPGFSKSKKYLHLESIYGILLSYGYCTLLFRQFPGNIQQLNLA